MLRLRMISQPTFISTSLITHHTSTLSVSFSRLFLPLFLLLLFFLPLHLLYSQTVPAHLESYRLLLLFLPYFPSPNASSSTSFIPQLQKVSLSHLLLFLLFILPLLLLFPSSSHCLKHSGPTRQGSRRVKGQQIV